MNEDKKNDHGPMQGPGFAAFIDMHDSTYAWDQDAATASEIVRELYSLIERVSDSRGGRIANFTGDGFLLLFGAAESAILCLAEAIAAWEPRRTLYIDRYFSGGVSAPDRFFLRLRTGLSFGNFSPIVIKGVTHYSGSGINKAQRCESASKDYFFRDSIGELKAPGYVFIDSSAENLIRSRGDLLISEELPAVFKGYFRAGTSPEASEPEARKQYIYAVWPRALAGPAARNGEKAPSGKTDSLALAAHAMKSADLLHELSAAATGRNRKKLVEEAVAAYRTALEIYSPGSMPGEYIATQMRLGAALRDHAALLSGREKVLKLEEAAVAQREAIKHSSPSAFPGEYAIAQNNLGNILRALAGLLSGEEKWEKARAAVAAYEEALRIYTRTDHPLDHAMTQNNLGNTLSDLTGSLSGEAKFQKFGESIIAYRKALEFFTPDSDPVRHAGTSNNLGTAIKNQALLLEGKLRLEQLEQAEEAYREALRFYDHEVSPSGWAMTRNNIGRVLREKALLQEGPVRAGGLSAAVSEYREALKIFTPETFPEYHAQVNANAGDALADLADASPPEKRAAVVEEARAAYGEALCIYSQENYPDRREKILAKLEKLAN